MAPKVERPPLEGSTSLKDALARVTAKRVDTEPKHQPQSHPLQKPKTLSDAISTLAPQAKVNRNSESESVADKKKNTPVDLSEEVLRKMLQVDEHEA